MKTKSISRRRFITTTTAGALFSIVPRHVLGGPGHVPPSDKLNIAGLGIGGMGGSNLRQCEAENIVALCDVDPVYADKTFRRYPDAKTYGDFRIMLAEQQNIDAVIIATPDHTHAVISKAVMAAGKHVYCQKPLTHDIYEARALTQAASETDVITQMGIQGHSGEGIRLICEWIWDGAIGEIDSVDAWCSLSYDPPGHASWSTPCAELPSQGESLPKYLDWELWLGPSRNRPYHSCYHPRVWRRWWDFGCGMMGDRGVHTLDSVFMALKLNHPTSVEATCSSDGKELHPATAVVKYQFPKRESLPALQLNWYEGQEPPRPPELEAGRVLPSEGGVIFKGKKGSIICGVYGNSPRLIPESAMQAYNRPPQTLKRVDVSHEENWISACKGKDTASAPFSYSGPLTKVTLLGNIAKRFQDNKLEWDGANMRVTNLEEANSWVRRPYHNGWTL